MKSGTKFFLREGLAIFNEFRVGVGGLDVRGGYLRKGGSTPSRNYVKSDPYTIPFGAHKFS